MAAPRRRSANQRIRFSARMATGAGLRAPTCFAGGRPGRRGEPRRVDVLRRCRRTARASARPLPAHQDACRQRAGSEEREGDPGEQRDTPQAIGQEAAEVQQHRATVRRRSSRPRPGCAVCAQSGRASRPMSKSCRSIRSSEQPRLRRKRRAARASCRVAPARRRPPGGRISACGGGCSSQPASVRRPNVGGGRTDPLKKRRAAEQIEVDRIRVRLEADVRRWRRRRQRVPVPLDFRAGPRTFTIRSASKRRHGPRPCVQDDQRRQRPAAARPPG